MESSTNVSDEENEYTLDPETDFAFPLDSDFSKQPNSRHWRKIVNEKRRAAKTLFLSKKVIERALPQEKEYTIPDKTLMGFGLRVRPSGAKSFSITAKNSLGKTVKYKIGDPALLSLDEARDLAREAKRQIKEGIDLSAKKQRNKDLLLDKLFQEYINDYCKGELSVNWQKRTEYIFRTYVRKDMGNSPLDKITRRELYECIKSAPTKSVRKHIKSVLSAFLTWAMEMEYIDKHVLKGSDLIGKLPSRDRVLSDREVVAAHISLEQLSSPSREIIKFLFYSGQRLREVANMQWKEIDFDNNIWTLPAGRSKNRKKHTLPLTDRMLEIINSMPQVSEHIFASPIAPHNPLSSFGKVARRLKGKASKENWRIHDIRRTVATGMARIGIAPHVIEAVENRCVIVSISGQIYNRYDYMKEKREALELWQKHLDGLEAKYKDEKPEEIIEEAVI